MDGKYIADGRIVRRNPCKTATGITMGFIVCEVSEHLGPEAAQEVADALNLHREHHPDKH